MAENTPKLAYLLDPLFQIENVNGKPLVGGYIEVYYAGTNEKYITYQNFDFTQNPFKIPLGSDGRAVVLAQTEQAYDVYVRDSFGNLVFSRLNLAPGGAGGVAFGMTKVNHDDTLTGNGTQLSPLGVSPLANLAVDDTMTAYEATVEGKESLVLGVNGDWFSSAISGISNDFVTNEEFSACCSAVKGGLDNKVDLSALNNYYTKTETWNTFLPRSGLDLSNYYTTAQTYNKYEIEDRLDSKQTKLTFGYDENSAISSINNSALAGGQGGDTTPWISGAKILADTQTLTDNMIVQVLSSFTLSGNKNHCIAVKGGTYRFPNAYELGDRISTTNYFMAASAMSGYLPNSSFSSYTASIQNNLNSNWDYTNSAYSLSINNFHNKLDISAFSSWSANLDLSGDYLPTSASGNFYPMTGNPSGFLTEHQDLSDYATTSVVNNISSYFSGEIDNKLDKSESGNYYPMTGNPSGFLTSHQSLDDYYKKTETSSKEEISAAIAAIPLGDEEVNNVVHNNSATWDNVVNKLDSSSYHELTAGDNIDIQNYVISSKDWTNEIREASANAFNEATAQIPEPFDPTYISGQIDNKLNKSESANYYPMTGNPSGFLTAHQDLSNYATTSQLEQVSASVSSIPTLSGGEGIQLVNEDGKTRIDLGLSAGSNISLVYDQETNIIRLDSEAGDLSNYYTKTDTSSKQEISAALQYISSNAGKTYTGVSPIVVNNTTNQISADTWEFSAGVGVTFIDDNDNKLTRIDVTGFSELSALSAAIDYVSGNAGHNYTGIAPIIVDNVNETISVTGGTLSAGPNIDLFESGGYVVISANGGGAGSQYTGISPIDVNNTTHQISAKGVHFGVQSPLYFVQDDNEAVVIGCSAGGGIAYTGDAQGALDEVYANSGVWLTAHQDISNLLPKSESANYYPMVGNPSGFLTAHQSLADYQTTADMANYQTTAAMTGYVSVSDYNDATARIAELEQVLQTYSGKWLIA